MVGNRAIDQTVLREYEGLIFSTAQLIVRKRPDYEADDIQQVLWIKTIRALRAFDPSRKDRDGYVFMCLRDQAKDLLRWHRRNEVFIEDLTSSEDESGRLETRDSFEERHGLSSSHDEIYGDVDEDDVVVPSTLSQLERRIVLLLYRDFKQTEAARILGIDKRQIEKAMRSIREKMADWRPTEDPDVSAAPPTPIASKRRSRPAAAARAA